MSNDNLHLGACIVQGRLHATVMSRNTDGTITVVATAEMDEASLRGHDCHAVMRAAEPAANRAGLIAAKLRAMATNYPANHLWDKLDAKTCLEAALLLDETHPRVLPLEVSRLVNQVRALCDATRRAGPGVAVEIPAELAEEGRKFMRGEPNLIVQMPFADVSSLGELLADNPQYS